MINGCGLKRFKPRHESATVTSVCYEEPVATAEIATTGLRTCPSPLYFAEVILVPKLIHLLPNTPFQVVVPRQRFLLPTK